MFSKTPKRKAHSGRISLLLCALLLMFVQFSFAKEPENDFQNWDMVTFRADLPHKLSVYAEAQTRIGNNLGYIDRLLLRPAVGYRVTPHWSLWQGYAWTPTFIPNYRDEQRLWQQSLFEHKMKRLTLINRTRLEERSIDHTGGTALRLRHLTRMTYPIGHSTKWLWITSAEAFINCNSVSNGPAAGFDQYRLYGGIGRNLSAQVLAEAGYLLDYLNRQAPTPDGYNHALFVGLNMTVK